MIRILVLAASCVASSPSLWELERLPAQAPGACLLADAAANVVGKLYVVEIWDKSKREWRYHKSFHLEVQARLEEGRLKKQGKFVRVRVAL